VVERRGGFCLPDVPLALDLFRRNGDVFSVFPAPGVDVAVDVFDFGRIAVRVIATTDRPGLRHVRCRLESLVQELVLRRVKLSLALSILRLGRRRQEAAETAQNQELA
jgi:hypothetical protein